MRLQPAIDLDEFEDTVSGFGDREDRRDRREARRERRRQKKSDRKDKRSDRRDTRRERRQERRLDRVDRKQDKVREKLSRVPGGAPSSPMSPRRSSAEPTLQPAPTSWRRQPAPTSWPSQEQPDEEGGWVDDLVDQAEDLLEDEEPEGEEPEESTEGMGAWRPFQRRPAAGPAAARPPTGDGAWGPSVRMGRKLRIQAAVGHRAAVIDLKPGLYLVAELPEAVTRTEFGVAPLLAPLMLTAARRAMDEPPRERRGPLASLFRRRRQEPIRYVQVQPVAQAPASAPLALPGPVEEPAAIVVPAPDVGWADDATVAAVYGCDRCERERR